VGKLAAWDMKLPLVKKQAFYSWLLAVREKRDDGSWFPGCMLERAHLEYAAEEVLSGELGKNAVSEGRKAVQKYGAANDLKSPASKRRKLDAGLLSSSSSSCGGPSPTTSTTTATATTTTTTTNATAIAVSFPTVLCADLVGAMLIRQTGRVVSREAAIRLTGFIEYIAAELLEFAGNATRDSKAAIISPRHILLALRGDKELYSMFPGLILGGGLMLHIHKILGSPMDELLEGSDEDKETSHQEFVSFDGSEGGGMVAKYLRAEDFHGEGEQPGGCKADSHRLPGDQGGHAEKQAASINDRLLRLVAVIPLPSVVLPLSSSCPIFHLFLTVAARLLSTIIRRPRLASCALASVLSTSFAAVLCGF
jgi:hypothetical protein